MVKLDTKNLQKKKHGRLIHSTVIYMYKATSVALNIKSDVITLDPLSDGMTLAADLVALATSSDEA